MKCHLLSHGASNAALNLAPSSRWTLRDKAAPVTSVFNSPENTMRIEYENKFSDLLLFNAVHQFMSPALQGLYILLSIFIFWSESISYSISCAASTTLYWYLGLWAFQFIFNAIYLYSRKNGSVLTKHTIELQEDSLLEETKFNKSFFYWHGVVRAVPRPGFIAIYVSALQAHIVPNRAFGSKEERKAFLALVKEKISAAAARV